MSAPVTSEELAAAGSCAVSLTSIAPYHAKSAAFGGATFEFHARAQTTVERAAELLPRLARDLTAARTEAEELRHNLRAVRDSACRAQEQITAERATSARLADKVIDLGRELEALRAAVWAHRAAHEAGEGETVALVRLYQLAEQA